MTEPFQLKTISYCEFRNNSEEFQNYKAYYTERHWYTISGISTDTHRKGGPIQRSQWLSKSERESEMVLKKSRSLSRAAN